MRRLSDLSKPLILNAKIFGQATSLPPLVIVHGLFGSARNWGVIGKRLADERQVVAVDMRNHASSDWAASHSYEDLAGDLADTLGELAQPVDILGHSMGGKAAMVLALQRPELLRRAIIADIAPVAYDHSQIGPIEAMRGVDLGQITTRQDAADQMVGIEEGLAPFLLQLLDMKDKKWRLNLDVLATEMDRIVGFPDVAGHFEGPTLFLSGADSTYVQPAHRGIIKRHFPTARFAKIPGAGHWLHAQKPREFEAAVRVFLAQ